MTIVQYISLNIIKLISLHINKLTKDEAADHPASHEDCSRSGSKARPITDQVPLKGKMNNYIRDNQSNNSHFFVLIHDSLKYMIVSSLCAQYIAAYVWCNYN